MHPKRILLPVGWGLVAAIAALEFLSLPGIALASRRKTADLDPRVRDVRIVFIKGNNEAAVRARQNLSKWTCFRLANSPSHADAILDFSQQQSVSGALISANRERSIVSAELTAKEGDVLWSGSATQDAGIINTGAGSAATCQQLVTPRLRDAANFSRMPAPHAAGSPILRRPAPECVCRPQAQRQQNRGAKIQAPG